MFDDRMFTDTYDLYRPTLSASASGVQKTSDPDTATASDQRCKFFPTPGSWVGNESGIRHEFDAILLIPNSQSLRPEKLGEQPDHVEIDSRRYVVVACWPLAGESYVKKALLKERKSD